MYLFLPLLSHQRSTSGWCGQWCARPSKMASSDWRRTGWLCGLLIMPPDSCCLTPGGGGVSWREQKTQASAVLTGWQHAFCDFVSSSLNTTHALSLHCLSSPKCLLKRREAVLSLFASNEKCCCIVSLIQRSVTMSREEKGLKHALICARLSLSALWQWQKLAWPLLSCHGEKKKKKRHAAFKQHLSLYGWQNKHSPFAFFCLCLEERREERLLRALSSLPFQLSLASFFLFADIGDDM